jgi:hypothetical protein
MGSILGTSLDILTPCTTDMDRREFEELRDLPGKAVNSDIQFGAPAEAAPFLLFENVRVSNSLGIDLRLNGKYNPEVRTIVFNFRIPNVGPICRVEVNSTKHGGSRTHKHSLHLEEDPRQNLPTKVIPRPDLERKTLREVWETLCREARITHNGRLVEPERKAGA